MQRTHVLLIACATLALAGCGGARSATYVDPNPDALFAGGGASAAPSEPFATHGADVAQRALALVRMRGALATARVLEPADPDAARDVIQRTLDVDFPVVEPELQLVRPAVRTRVRTALTLLAARPPADVAGYAVMIQRLVAQLAAVDTAVVPIAARQDAAFRAGVLIDSINDAATRYGDAVAGGLSAEEAAAEYRTAYGILLDVRTRGIDAISIDDRRKAQSLVTTAVNRSMPSPTLAADPRDATAAATELGLAADYLATSSGADTTLPSPDPSSPEQWRALKRTIAGVVETWSRGDVTAARRAVRTAATELSPVATASLASVDPDQVVTIMRGLAIDLPAELRTGGDPETVAARIDADIDSAVTAIEQELELLRQGDEGE